MTRRVVLLTWGVALVFAASDPVAVLTGAGALEVNGRTLSRPLTSAVTLFSGDQIQTGSSTAVVWLGGQARLTVDRNSAFQLERKPGAKELILRQGAIRFQTGASQEALAIRAGDHLVRPEVHSEGAVMLRPDRTAEAMTWSGAASVTDQSTGTSKRLTGRSGLLLAGSDGRMVFTGRTSPITGIQYVEHPNARKPCPVSPSQTKDGKCKCPPPSDATNPPEGDRNCGHGNGP